MNFFILIMLILCLIGLIDKILNNKLGLVAAFDKGMDSMGGIAMSMIGFYCIAITLIQNNVDVITKISADSSLDPSIVVGSILAPDMGGFSIVSGLGNSTFLIFSGVILTATLGQTISFQLPIFLASLKKEDLNRIFNKGFTGNNGRNNSKSTGLGLYLVKELCDKLGHKIDVDSEYKQYTKFTITFKCDL